MFRYLINQTPKPSRFAGSHRRKAAAGNTFDAAIQKYPDAKPLFHSDRGYQYTSKVFKAKLDTAGMTQSMSRVGRCIDNGPIEALWGTLKAEMYYLHRSLDYDSLKAAIEQYIHFYSNARYQARLGGPRAYGIPCSVANGGVNRQNKNGRLPISISITLFSFYGYTRR